MVEWGGGGTLCLVDSGWGVGGGTLCLGDSGGKTGKVRVSDCAH